VTVRKIADFIRWFFDRKMDWDPLRFTVPLIFGLFLIVPEALKESLAATRQQTSQGIISSYEMSNHNRCRYSFTVNGKIYNGVSSAPTLDTEAGRRVVVYFDPKNPEVNALEDLSAKSRRDGGFLWMLVAAIGAIVGFVVLPKAARRLAKRS
jgi:hypothetical protein